MDECILLAIAESVAILSELIDYTSIQEMLEEREEEVNCQGFDICRSLVTINSAAPAQTLTPIHVAKTQVHNRAPRPDDASD
jgi:hypothetical protein